MSISLSNDYFSNKKIEEEGNPLAISNGSVPYEHLRTENIEESQKKIPPITATQNIEPSTLTGNPGRYKNPILAIFAVMYIARKTMQDVAKRSKEETRIMKKYWELISHEVSGHHDTAMKATEKTQKLVGVFGVFFLAIPCVFKNMSQENIEWLNTNLIYPISQKIPFISLIHKEKEKRDEAINSMTKQGQEMANQSIKLWGDSTQMANQRDVVVGTQQSDASRTEYQSRQDEKRNEDESIKTIDQMTQRLMEQEVRCFEIRG